MTDTESQRGRRAASGPVGGEKSKARSSRVRPFLSARTREFTCIAPSSSEFRRQRRGDVLRCPRPVDGELAVLIRDPDAETGPGRRNEQPTCAFDG